RGGARFGPRTLDLDLVFYDDLTLDGPGHLQIPRAEMRHAFVLKPLADIAPGYVHPRLGRPLADLWADSGMSIGEVVDLASTSP
ncbi:MAG: 2-amino-4-hydroxy-6-hydroxymethyldihydropteridine diphosphokinase, partial [Xanthomonadales bacterium]|nr:2-amino-4-hydroxy-6-hydroxymethyldihydropteridine diphosphokinase [Xanthomonadales bacterium]